MASASRIHVGTSGWTYDDWSGPFYPAEVKGSERLSFYATRFDTVELNASFYRFPSAVMIDAWNRRLSHRFHMVVKGHRRITHFSKLSGCAESLAGFMERLLDLRTLRVVLWQLPPSLHRDLPRLEEFLILLEKTTPRGRGRRRVRHAVEFRHASWWDDEVGASLARHAVSFVAVSHPRLPEDVVRTTDLIYIRFHGKGRQLYDYDYSDAELAHWVGRLSDDLPRRDVYAFFNNDWHANAPRNAATFRALLEGRERKPPGGSRGSFG